MKMIKKAFQSSKRQTIRAGALFDLFVLCATVQILSCVTFKTGKVESAFVILLLVKVTITSVKKKDCLIVIVKYTHWSPK